MLKSKGKSTPWLIIVVVAVVAAMTTVALLMLKAKKKHLKKCAANDACTCMSFDCENEPAADEADGTEED